MRKIIRNMRNSNPAGALFPEIRQKILATLYGRPKRWWFLSELASFIETRPSSLQRELKSLSDSGILQTKRDGNRVYFSAETTSPIFEPLRELIEKILGIEKGIYSALQPFASRISFAFIYGSVARGEERSLSDVDVIVVGDIGLADLSATLRDLEKRFGREINATCYSLPEFEKKLRKQNHFLKSVMKGRRILLIGDGNELDEIVGESDRTASRNQ